MKILYGVQGTGHGHVVRSREVVRELKALGHDVHCILSARQPGSFPGMEIFEPYTLFRGFTGVVEKGRIKNAKTVAQLQIRRFFRDARSFDASAFDAIVTDFDPVAGWIARYSGLPSVGLGHLYAYCHPVPVPAMSVPARLLLRTFVPIYTPVRTFVGLNWHHFGSPCLPPTIPADVRRAGENAEARAEKILVYLPAENDADIAAFLNPFVDFEFFVYHRARRHQDVGNIRFRGYDREGFLRDLSECSGVIANAGFSLASEALHLGKKVLLRPITGHPEQHLNGKILTRLELGMVMKKLDPVVLRRWLEAPSLPPMAYPDVVRPFARWLGEGNWNRPAELVERVWSEVKWPNDYPIPQSP